MSDKSKDQTSEPPESIASAVSAEDTVTRKLTLADVDVQMLFGEHDRYLRMVEEKFDAKITARGETVTFTGAADEVEQLEKVFTDLLIRLGSGSPLTDQYVRYAINLITEGHEGPAERINNGDDGALLDSSNGIGVQPRTIGQREYLEAIDRSDIVFSIGPAGTGKTFLAVAAGVARLKAGKVKRLIFVRPAVEAGESLGFLPGDIRAKVDPYLRPIYDALNDLLTSERVRRLMETNVIEIAPLAFMRGRTLSDAQMKMFLTRLGERSKAVVTGDVTQIDLIEPKKSGLLSAERFLKEIEGLEFISLTERDVVRHKLVQEIILAYERQPRETE
jgi:phosphate starvation-inducible PhoH-like protein